MRRLMKWAQFTHHAQPLIVQVISLIRNISKILELNDTAHLSRTENLVVSLVYRIIVALPCQLLSPFALSPLTEQIYNYILEQQIFIENIFERNVKIYNYCIDIEILGIGYLSCLILQLVFNLWYIQLSEIRKYFNI